MKKILSAIFSIILCGAIHAQSNITIVGKIMDSLTNTAVPYTTIAMYDASNQLVNGNISSEDGSFLIDGIEIGSYRMVISCVGYQSLEKSMLIGQLNEHYDLGNILITSMSTQLNEVLVTGEQGQISQGLDRKSYNLNSNIAQSGGSAMDAMKAMPSVSFDQDGKVILRGSDRVIVLIDGKQSSLTGYGNQKGLDNIPAANIERIEIINNPSSKYDANGMAGIINIIYKKDRQAGLHGSIGFAYGLGVLSKRMNDLPTQLGSYSPTPKYIPSLDLNLRKNKTNFFLQSETIFQERLPNNEFTTRFYDDGRIIKSQVPENRTQTHYILKGGMDYHFNEQNILSFSGIYDWESHTDTAQVPYINQEGNRNRYIAWNEKEITGYMNYALRYEHKYNQHGHSLQADIQYSRGWEDETYFLNDSSFIRSDGRDITTVLGTEHITSASLDYTRPGASGRFETGTKIQVRNLPVEYEQVRDENSMLYEGLGNWSKWGERIYAGYLNWVHEKDKYSVEGGMRAEYTSVFYNMDESNIYYDENDAYDYFRLFPNIRFTYNLNPNNRISAFINQRIDRPGEPELRMYTKSDDHELVKVGNPYLRPQLTQSAEIAYRNYWENGSLFISGYFRNIKDAFQRVYTEDNTSIYDIVVKSYANTGRMQNIGMELVFSQDITDSWEFSGNFNYYQITIDEYTGSLLFPYPHTFFVNGSSDGTWDAKITSTLDVSQDLQFQITGLYFAERVIPQGIQLSRSSIDIGIKKKLWKTRGEITIAATDIFNRFGLRQKIEGEGFSADYQNFYETQSIRMGLKYKF